MVGSLTLAAGGLWGTRRADDAGTLVLLRPIAATATLLPLVVEPAPVPELGPVTPAWPRSRV